MGPAVSRIRVTYAINILNIYHRSTTSSLPHKEPSARSTGNQTRVRATYDTAQSPSEDRRQPSVDLSDDGLPSWRGMKERAKSTPKRPQGTIEKSTSVDLDPSHDATCEPKTKRALVSDLLGNRVDSRYLPNSTNFHMLTLNRLQQKPRIDH